MFGSIGSAIQSGWQFIASGVKSGVESTISIARNVSEALSLEYEDVLSGVETAQEAVSAWTKLNELPGFYDVTDKFALKTTFDYREKYVMQMEVVGKDTVSGKDINVWVTLENDKPLTKEEWLEYARKEFTDHPFGYSYIIDYVNDWNYYIRE
jgi:hypothetical protein